MWEKYWGLQRGPFGGPTVFVSNEGKAEALARVLHAIERVEGLVVVRGRSGVGKTTLLDRAVEEARGPTRRFARLIGPADGPAFLESLAVALGWRGASRNASESWRATTQALTLRMAQRLQTVVVIDDARALLRGPGRADLDRLVRHASTAGHGLTVVLSLPESPGLDPLPGPAPWHLEATLLPLTHSETEQYVSEKLRWAGRTEPTFDDGAIAALTDLSEGVPRGIDRLAALSLMAGALRQFTRIGPGVVEGVARDCLPVRPETAA